MYTALFVEQCLAWLILAPLSFDLLSCVSLSSALLICFGLALLRLAWHALNGLKQF